jgi:peptide subunit release factor 1 (eRF1)
MPACSPLKSIATIVTSGSDTFSTKNVSKMKTRVPSCRRRDRSHEDGERGTFVERTIAALREKDAETDVEKVQELMDAWKSGGLGVAGPEATLSAFQLSQVDELIITGSTDTLKSVQELPEDTALGDLQVITSNLGGAGDEGQLKVSDELITRAQQTAARIRFIEDASLLADAGGVGALLRFRI